MLEAFKCYSQAIGLLFNNIKSYACLVVMNVLFLGLVLFTPFLIYFIPNGISTGDMLLIASLIVGSIFIIVNYPMLILTQNIVDLGEMDEAFSLKDLFKTNLSWRRIFAIGIAINFVIISFIIALFVFSQLSASTDIIISFATFLLFVQLFASLFNYIYINRANDQNKLQSFGCIMALIGRHAKLFYCFFGVYVLISLINCYLVCIFFSGMDELLTFVVKGQSLADVQLSFIHAGFSIVILVLFNTVSLTAKAQLYRTIRGLEDKK